MTPSDRHLAPSPSPDPRTPRQASYGSFASPASATLRSPRFIRRRAASALQLKRSGDLTQQRTDSEHDSFVDGTLLWTRRSDDASQPLWSPALTSPSLDSRPRFSQAFTSEPGSLLPDRDGPLAQSKADEHVHSDSDSDSHSDDEHKPNLRARATRRSRQLGLDAGQAVDSIWTRLKLAASVPKLSGIQKNVLKCVVAYFLASLFTFIDPLAVLAAAPFDIDRLDGMHMVATIATYYNPGKTAGGMIEANLFMLWATLFSLIVCVGSMATAVLLNDDDLEILSHALVLTFWLAGSMGLLAWTRVKVAKPTFGTACSMVVLINTTIICKEGAVHLGIFQTRVIAQNFYMAFLGIAISNIVCFCLFRGSSVAKLQGDINKTLDSFARLVDMLVSIFLLEEQLRSNDESLKRAVNAHHDSFVALKKRLDDAKMEFQDARIQRTHVAYDSIVASMNRLAQHINALRTACTLQDAHLERQAEEHGESGAAGFDSFREHVGPSLKNLSSVMRKTFRSLRTSFLRSRAALAEKAALVDADVEDGLGADQINQLNLDLQASLRDFQRDHARALRRHYRHHPSEQLHPAHENTFELSIAPAFDVSRLNEEIFLVFFFIYQLEELVKELEALIKIFADIRIEEEDIEHREAARRQRFGVFLPLVRPFFRLIPATRSGKKPYPTRWRTLWGRFVTLLPVGKNARSNGLKTAGELRGQRHIEERDVTLKGRIKRIIWQVGVALRRHDVRFAIKSGIGAGLLGAPAFIFSTRDLWIKYRMEWALVSYMVVVATTVGQTTFNASWRIGGTIIGVLVAAVAYLLFLPYPILLAFFGAVFSAPCFYFIVVKPTYATSGRFVLLAYNLTCLGSYNTLDENPNVWMVAFRRATAVMIGTIWGLIITAVIWPYEARRELRKDLATLLLNAAFLYEQLVQTYSKPSSVPLIQEHANGFEEPTETTSLLTKAGARHLKAMTDDFAELELKLQVSLIRIGALLSQTKHELRLKGPFPMKAYAQIIQKVQILLDSLHSMRMVTLREGWYTSVRREFILPANAEQREMVGNIISYLYLLASAVSLKLPLPAYLPPAAAARQRMVDKISTLPMQGIGELLQSLFGIIAHDSVAEFDALFDTTEDANGNLGTECNTEPDARETSDGEESSEADLCILSCDCTWKVTTLKSERGQT
ncbi:hypothetical protein E5Q_02666 [Mixia osmundae IAM 14324]|uniref:Uncharacterized protein n=1 Tax=Mixia osmundae (strain CBS 9802 / IAM 14324 / JCM 22182 / KY 12970) TaxID=764103 RepID=G7DZJ6_MIXOS|nr:hypothetical protein E5Q_02666 [Mixia osmundae IAM 14324]